MTAYDPSRKTIFTDLETTGLDRGRREVWEIGLVVREPGLPDVEYEWQLSPRMDTAEETGLRIGGYYRRNRLAAHPPGAAVSVVFPGKPELPAGARVNTVDTGSARSLATDLAIMFDGAQIVGMCPWFDEHSLWRFLRDNGHALTCDYHLVDVESMAAGYAHAAARWAPDRWRDARPGRREALDRVQQGPGWTSADLSLVVGIDPPIDRHRALVDARWGRDVVDVITGHEPTRDSPSAAQERVPATLSWVYVS